MTTVQTQLLEQDITNLLGLGDLDEGEQLVFLSEIGDVVLESALIRLMADLNDEQVATLEQFMETKPEGETLMKHLLTHHTGFETILEEEITAFKKDALAVLEDEAVATTQ